MVRDGVAVYKHAKKKTELDQYPVIFVSQQLQQQKQHLVNNPYLNRGHLLRSGSQSQSRIWLILLVTELVV